MFDPKLRLQGKLVGFNPSFVQKFQYVLKELGASLVQRN